MTTTMMRSVILTLSLLLAVLANGQQTARPVLSSYTLEAGSGHLAETYLSPLKYKGWNVALGYERMQAMRFDPERWVMQYQGRLSMARTENPARNARMWDLNLDFGWGMAHRWHLEKGISLYFGGSTSAAVGAFYNPRNSNNPVAAKASWTVNALGLAAWNTRYRSLPLCVRYQVEMPLTGIFFSPAYGELYYEIYLGNHSNLVHGAWPGNYFRLNNMLSVDLRFGGTTLRLGYRADVHSSKIENIVTRRIEHMAVVGVVCEWLSLSPRNEEYAKTVSALY